MRRTAKKFIDYNEYRDRPFGLKWGTAFAMEELVNGIKKNEEEARKQPLPKQQMTLQEIDSILTEAFLSRKAVIIQLNLKDEFGRLLDEVEGHFIGEDYEDYFMIDHQPILWEDVRYIELKETKKWFVT
ncbi:TPA: hypothetical protein QFQ54_002098 [Enterococcus faecium]|uniref:hypothetical protein n=1 Tax=Enterococcus faecium TaxID=1352 RepID=UPI00145C3709|nr:hypothetical protein [Enterococcus faecium]NMP53304.1 hypothetical protein [Enterococcus faecium]